MRIVLYADFLSTKHLTVTTAFYKDLVLETARQHAADTFILITHAPAGDTREYPANILIHVARHFGSKNRAFRWLNKFLVARTLKTLGADLFITANRFYVARYSMPCCLLLLHPFTPPRKSLADVAVTGQQAPWIRANKQVHTAMKKADTTVVFTRHYAQLLENEFCIPIQKIKWLPVDIIGKPGVLSWEEKEHTKNKYTAGAEYFLFAGDIHQRFDLLALLKAFSLFKKWQQSGMQLVIAGGSTSYTGQLVQKLASFKYRKEVHLVTDPCKKVLLELTASAYAFLYPSSDDHFPLPVLTAMRSGVPVITYETPVNQDIAGNTLIYAQPTVESLSASMQTVYKDEGFRARCIESASLHIAQNYKTDIIAAFYGIFQNSLQSKS